VRFIIVVHKYVRDMSSFL